MALPWSALLLVGGPSLAAIATGLVYGRGKRVWRRHLCPIAGPLALLSRGAPLHFAVDRAAWDAAPRPPRPVYCPLLIDAPVQSKPTPHVGTAPEAPYTLAFNLTHQPAASVPAGFDGNGPLVLQIVAPLYADALALRAARAFETARPFVLPQLAALRRERHFG